MLSARLNDGRTTLLVDRHACSENRQEGTLTFCATPPSFSHNFTGYKQFCFCSTSFLAYSRTRIRKTGLTAPLVMPIVRRRLMTITGLIAKKQHFCSCRRRWALSAKLFGIVLERGRAMVMTVNSYLPIPVVQYK